MFEYVNVFYFLLKKKDENNGDMVRLLCVIQLREIRYLGGDDVNGDISF